MANERMERVAALLVLTLVAFVLDNKASAVQMATGKRLSTSGSDRTTRYVQSNKIVSLNGKSHFSWLDWNSSTTKASSYDQASESWTGTAALGTGTDNHAGPALAIDNEGYLQAIFGPHHGPFKYAVSANPNDTSLWIQQSSFRSDATYPRTILSTSRTAEATEIRGSSITSVPENQKLFVNYC